MSISFISQQHSEQYEKLLREMTNTDCYHRSMAYLLTLDSVCASHIGDVFDIKKDSIKPDGLFCAWQTGTSLKTIRLAFSLWNGYCYYTDRTYTDEDGCEQPLSSPYYSVDKIFCSSLAPYYYEAIKLRYPEYNK